MSNWTPPNSIPVDRRNPSTSFEADLPAVLDWLSTQYPGGHVVGLFVTARDTGHTYRVDGKDSQGYRLTRMVTEAEVAALRERVTVLTEELETVRTTSPVSYTVTPDGWVRLSGLSPAASPAVAATVSGAEIP